MTDFIAGLIFAFVGSLHCVGMCGPIALALSAPDTGRVRFVVGRLLYNGGRTVTYMLLGVVAGSIGKTVALAGVQQILSIVLGVILVLFGLFPFLQSRLVPRVPAFGNFTRSLSQKLGGLLGQRSFPALVLVGILNGLLPCGFVYLALAASVTTGEILRSVVFMAGFGIGTIPVMFAVSLLGKQVGAGIRKKLRIVVPVLTVLLGVLLVLRGSNLGIPYVSPRVEKAPQAEEVRCH
jgi:sulfite exporter TauE/SafE